MRSELSAELREHVKFRRFAPTKKIMPFQRLLGGNNILSQVPKYEYMDMNYGERLAGELQRTPGAAGRPKVLLVG
jgi:hypothetical protein